MQHRTATLDNRRIAYTSETTFLVQVGKGPKGGYTTRYGVKGDLETAFFYYCSINVGNGYKKRLVSWDLNKPVLVRQTSA